MANFKSPNDEQKLNSVTEMTTASEIDPNAQLIDAARRELYELWMVGLNSGPSDIPSFAALKVEARKRPRL